MNQNLQRCFTVFTATYNRAHTLPRVYESLKNQTFKDFEWLIVDDGSSDGTKELVGQWQKESLLTIRYFYQENRGKHVAFNRGVREAAGELFLTLDSDDTCVPRALELFLYHWKKIEPTVREQFSGITCLCMDTSGKIVGSRFPANDMDTSPITIHTKYGVEGEKWGFHRSSILKRYPFPEFPGERFVPEGLVWNRLASQYKIRFINEALRVYEGRPDGLSASIMKLRARNPSGTREYYFEFTQLVIPLKYRLKAFINYFRFSAHGRVPMRVALRDLGQPFPGLFFLPIGYLFYLADRRAIKK